MEKQLREGEILDAMLSIKNESNSIGDDLNDEEVEQLENLFEQSNVLEDDDFTLLLYSSSMKVLGEFEKTITLKAKYRELRRELRQHRDLILKDVVKLEPFLGEEKVKSFFENDSEKLNRFRCLYGLSAEEHYCILAHDFPIRTVSMINTLKTINNVIIQYGLHRPKIVLVAGGDHLERHDWSLGNNDVRFDIEGLYHELDHHKAVILQPTAPLSSHKIKVMELKEMTSCHS